VPGHGATSPTSQRLSGSNPGQARAAEHPELWRRFTITRVALSPARPGSPAKRSPHRPGSPTPRSPSTSAAGVVHFHAIIRLDGPAGAASTPPAWATVALLTDAVAQAARTVHIKIPPARQVAARTLAWGRELDMRPVTTSGELTDSKVAAYVAKYATKAAECTGTLDRRINPADQLAQLPVRDHARRHIAECLRLAKLPALEHLHLAAWAHMLGCGGHFSTKPHLLHHPRHTPRRPRRPSHARCTTIAPASGSTSGRASAICRSRPCGRPRSPSSTASC
jgi:hypothetical protein